MRIRATQEAAARLGWIGCVIGVLSLVAVGFMPAALRLQSQAKFREFLAPEEVEQMTEWAMDEALPAIVAGVALNAAVLFFAVALVRRKSWAPRGWLVTCGVVALISFLDAWHSDVFLLPWLGPAFRLGLLLFSVHVLCTSSGSSEAEGHAARDSKP